MARREIWNYEERYEGVEVDEESRWEVTFRVVAEGPDLWSAVEAARELVGHEDFQPAAVELLE